MLKIKTFNNGIIKIDENGDIHILHCNSSYDIKWSLDQYKLVNSIVDVFEVQPERSKREDSQKCEMRCSEHCGNTVRRK